MPIATFVCPTYDGAGYLAETIESIRRQSVKDWELVIVDDASKDTTPDLLKWYIKEDSRIRVKRHKKNTGSPGARNTGNRLARSDLLLVIDHDDLCHEHRLRDTLKHFSKYPDTDIFHAGWVECNIMGDPATEPFKPMALTKKKFEEGNILFCQSTAAMPKKVALEYPYRLLPGRTDDNVALDDWLSASLKFRTSNRVMCGVRRLPMGQMQKIREQQGLGPSWRA